MQIRCVAWLALRLVFDGCLMVENHHRQTENEEPGLDLGIVRVCTGPCIE